MNSGWRGLEFDPALIHHILSLLPHHFSIPRTRCACSAVVAYVASRYAPHAASGDADSDGDALAESVEESNGLAYGVCGACGARTVARAKRGCARHFGAIATVSHLFLCGLLIACVVIQYVVRPAVASSPPPLIPSFPRLTSATTGLLVARIAARAVERSRRWRQDMNTTAWVSPLASYSVGSSPPPCLMPRGGGLRMQAIQSTVTIGTQLRATNNASSLVYMISYEARVLSLPGGVRRGVGGRGSRRKNCRLVTKKQKSFKTISSLTVWMEETVSDVVAVLFVHDPRRGGGGRAV